MTTQSRRRLGVILYVLCLTALLCTGGLAVFGQHWLHRGITYGPPHDIPLAGVYPYGVNAALEQYTPAQRDRVLSQLSDDGFRWVRQVLPWDRVEPRQGDYEWGIRDQIVEDVAHHDLHLILVIHRAPTWARTSSDADPHALPAEPADLANFAAAVAERYAGRLAAVEVWREPNLQLYRAEGPSWAGGPDPAEYVTHLRATYQAVKAVDPDIVVLNAGLAPTTENSRRATSDLNFLEGMYDAGAAPYFDALAARPLGFWSGPDDRRVDPDVLNFSRVLLLREIMVRHGDAGKAVWAVEFGWNALPADWTGQPSPWGTDDPQKQAQRAVEAVRRAQAEWPWMGPLLALHLDPAAPPDDPIQGFALFDQELEPRLTYTALRDLIAEHTVGVGRYPADAWFAGTDWQPAGDSTVQRTPEGEIVVSRPALLGLDHIPPFGHFYFAMALLLVAILVVTWRLDGLVHLPRWEVTLALVVSVFLLSPWLPLTLIAIAGLFALFVVRLDLGLALIVLFIPFFRFPKYFGPQPVSGLELFTWLALAAWCVRQLPDLIYAPRTTHHARRTTVLRPASYVSRLTSLDYAVTLLILISLFSPFIAENTGVAIHELRVVVIDSALFYFLVRFSDLSRFGLLSPDDNRAVVNGGLPSTASEKLAVWRLVDALVLAGFLVALYGFYQYVFSGDVIVAEGVRRMRGVYPSPNNLSLFLGRILPLVGVVAVWGTGVRWRRGFYAVASAVIAGALFLTFSRAAWLVGLPAAVLFVGAMRGRRALKAAMAAVVALALSVLPFAGTARIASLFELAPGSSTYRRLKLWQSALHMIRDHPLFGVGLDNFLYQYRERYVLAGARDDPSLSHPHNWLLDFWARLGVLGVAAFAWLVAAFFRTGWRLHQRLDEDSQVLVLGLMASMVYALAHGLLDNFYFLIDLAYLFMLTVGIVARDV